MTATIVHSLDWKALPLDTLPYGWRALMATWLERAGVPGPVVEDVRLAASELLTNACRHGPADVEIRMRVEVGAGWVGLGVWDASPQVPQSQPDPLVTLADGADLDAVLAAFAPEELERGRGLGIVQGVGRDFTVVRTTPGKWVRVSFPF
ncbi:hypothetical protein Acsp03_71900 [Actinomadura sp. NBRC 104412]|uniref:ATP-binding protein n=1 Tax=Actinomadura sp. NBRC 104412 TaxID=3032203 RepID=UPI0024A43325|nr:ATP-binding protein [Actinomadura sp. NBRC 104412]GLZ09724.1 hypothetical protein Acsp03_71900 [Actinomadura sp. NBRC 104412]